MLTVETNVKSVSAALPTDDSEFAPDTDDSSDADSVSTGGPDKPHMADLCFPALNYLHRCHKILASIYTMPALPMFQVSKG